MKPAPHRPLVLLAALFATMSACDRSAGPPTTDAGADGGTDVLLDTPSPIDAPDAPTPDAPTPDAPDASCLPQQTRCGVTCVDTATDTAHCGRCEQPCPAGVACVAGTCACPAGQHPVGSRCVPTGSAPRPIAPLSLGDVTHRRPTLRWSLPPEFDGALVELCRDRACTMVIETLSATGTSARPLTDLPARSVVFWRVRGRVGAVTDTAHGPTWLFHVPAVSASIDTSFNPHLDVDGDGFDDLVVGSPIAPSGSRQAVGAATVFRGTASGLSATPARALQGTEANDYFGSSVAGAGDLNGDGYADVVIGGFNATREGRVNTGLASVFHGGAAGIGATPDRVLVGATAQARFGSAVASAGDLDGDGYADLVVAASEASPGGRTQAGTVSVFRGSATGVGAAAARVLEGVAAGERFGMSVASAGDVNGDGYGDLVVGASEASPGGRMYSGATSVFHGSAAGVGATPALLLEGVGALDRFGGSVSSAGDVNGDGYSDLVVGAQLATTSVRDRGGAASVFLGGAVGITAASVRVLAGAWSDQFGCSVASAGDVNGDGFGDLVVGAKTASGGGLENAGAASVFHGSAAGITVVPARVVGGNAAMSSFGGSVAGAGDLNRDGYADLVIGAPFSSPGGRTQAGTASVFHGSTTGIATTATLILEGQSENETFGRSVASAWGENGARDVDRLRMCPHARHVHGRSLACWARRCRPLPAATLRT